MTKNGKEIKSYMTNWTPLEILEYNITQKIEKFAGYLEEDSKKVCTKGNLIPLKELIDKWLALKEIRK